jgi:hypothetical protein
VAGQWNNSILVPEWVAISSVVASASVAIAVPFIAARNERRRYERQSLDARRDELRELLDGAVQHLFSGYDILYSIAGEPSEPDRSSEGLHQFGEQLREETRRIAVYGLRVGLRLPAGATLVQKQTEVNRIFLEYEFEYSTYLKRKGEEGITMPPPPHEKAFEGIRDLREEIRAYLGVVPPLEVAGRDA